MSVDSKMTAIADAIRAHTGGTDALTLDGMAEAIAAIEAGGIDTSEFLSSFTKIETGTFIFATGSQQDINIYHHDCVVNKAFLFFVISSDASWSTSYKTVQAAFGYDSDVSSRTAGTRFSAVVGTDKSGTYTGGSVFGGTYDESGTLLVPFSYYESSQRGGFYYDIRGYLYFDSPSSSTNLTYLVGKEYRWILLSN